MGKHRANITRRDLLTRYANVERISFADAYDLHAETDIEVLRDAVDLLERDRGLPFPQRRSFARSQPTTTVQGQTR